MAWFRVMGLESVEYHRSTVLAGLDDHPGQALRYYGSRGETPLCWGGSVAGRLGLEGRVDDDGYDAIFGPGGAIDPHLGERMVRARRPGVELVVSAHKSVAVLGVMGACDDMHAIVDAETDATLAFLDEWFRRQGGRRGRAGTRTATAGLLWARTRHLTTRAADPEPHDHILIANLTEMLDARGGWKALDTGGLRDLVHAATMVGRHAAAECAVRLGYAIEADPGPSGKLGHWRLTGIPDEVLTLFSKRSAEIDEATAPDGFDSYRSRGIVVRNTRSRKADHHAPDLWSAWRQELAAAGIDPDQLRHQFDHQQRQGRRPVQVLTDAGRATVVEQILAPDGPLAQRKVFTRPDIIRAAAPLLYGCAHKELDQVVSAVISYHEAVRLVGQPGARGRAWAVASALATEEAVGAVAGVLAARPGPALDRAAVTSHVASHDRARYFDLTRGQRRAVAAVCTSGRGLDLLIGVAGSGKTTALTVVHDAYRRAGYRVIGTAISGQAARTLGTETGIDSRTTASLTARLDQGTTVLDGRTLVVIDEAGMTDDRSLLHLLQAVERAGAKAVVVGDHRQLGAVGAGGGLEALLDRNPEAVHVLDENVRQADPTERNALDHLRAGDAADQALDWYRANNRIQPQPTSGEAIAAAVGAWHGDLDEGKESVLLAWRRNDVAALNRVARRALVADGTITGTAIAAPGGRTYAAGDRVVMLAPGAGRSHVTSERATVTHVDDDQLAVRFQDGRSATLTGTAIDLEHLDHAYALTVHRMQGATVDRAHLLADGGGRELTYVAMSRARESTHVHVVADDLDQAVEDLTREWSTERRQRWVLDTDAPATERQPQRPALAKRPSPEHRSWQVKPETVALEHATEDDQQAKVEQINRRLDALQDRRPTPGRGLGRG